MKIAIIGRTQLLYETALRLAADGHEIKCVITAKAAPEYKRDEKDFKLLAKKLGAEFFLANSIDVPQIKVACQGLDIGISMNWISIIEPRHLKLFRTGILNAHFGDLPKYRGNACPNWAILNNDKVVTYSIHLMEGGKLDSGRIVRQEHLSLGKDKTITDVYEWSEHQTPLMFTEALELLADDNDFTLKYADINSPESFRCYPRLPEDSHINWRDTVVSVHNLIRASCSPFPGAYCYLRDRSVVRKLYILKSRVVEQNTTDLAVPGHVLQNNKLSGESYVRCGSGVIALLSCRYEDEDEPFKPGQRWRSIRMRLSVNSADWLWELSKTN